MSENTRTFVAIAVPSPQADKLAQLQVELATEVAGCRWVAAMPFHVTMAFLGDVRNRDLNDVCRAVVQGAGTFEPLEVGLQGIGGFPDARKPSVIWAGLTAPDLKPLLDLRAAVARALAQEGYRPDEHRFHPHVTLGRLKPTSRSSSDLTQLFERYRGWSGGTFRVRELITFASTPTSSGPSYAPLGRAALKGEKNDLPP
jgi:2'-5' RNA ligase